MKRVDETVQELGRGIGHFIREQRNTAQLSLRQLARLAGVSNPYLSQVERGLRKPSARILQARVSELPKEVAELRHRLEPAELRKDGRGIPG